MKREIKEFHDRQTGEEKAICDQLYAILSAEYSDVEHKIWHRHPVWFIDDNPVVGYSKLKAGIRLMFWSGDSFEESGLKAGTGKFKDASVLYTSEDQINEDDVKRWLQKARLIQWDYKNIYKRKGKLIRLK